MKLVKESIARRPMPKEEFLEWLDNFIETHTELEDDWLWIVDALVNDDVSDDEALYYHFREGDVSEDAIRELLDKRTEFLNYGLDIQL